MNAASTGRGLVHRRICGIALLVAPLALGMGIGVAPAHARNLNPGIAPIQSHPHGKSYSEWAAEWWQWAWRIPAPVNPVIDETGAHCAEGQSGPVWFLAGNFGGTTTRHCSVPTGKAFFFPLLNQAWVQVSTDPDLSIEDIRAMIAVFIDEGLVSAEIDGRAVVNPHTYREQSVVFTGEFVADNIFGIGAHLCPLGADGMFQCYPSLDDGIYLFVNPLPPGDHILHIAASVPSSGFALDVTYHLHVGK